jgi:hypothetical protein
MVADPIRLERATFAFGGNSPGLMKRLEGEVLYLLADVLPGEEDRLAIRKSSVDLHQFSGAGEKSACGSGGGAGVVDWLSVVAFPHAGQGAAD